MKHSNLYKAFQVTSKLLGKAQSTCVRMELKHESNPKIIYTEIFCIAFLEALSFKSTWRREPFLQCSFHLKSRVTQFLLQQKYMLRQQSITKKDLWQD